MKLLLFTLFLISCKRECPSSLYTCPSPKYEPAPVTKVKPHHKVGECFVFIKKSKEKWEDRPYDVIVKILEVGEEQYLVKTVGIYEGYYSDLGVYMAFFDDKKPIPCP